MNQIKSLLFAAIIFVAIQGCAQHQPTEKSVHESFYVDSARKFSFCPLSDDSSESQAVFLGPTIGACALVSATDAKMTREECRQAQQDIFSNRSMTVTLDSNLTFCGKDAIIWEYYGDIDGRDMESLELAIITDDKAYCVQETWPHADYSQHATTLRHSLLEFNFEGQIQHPPNGDQTVLFVDSVRRFSFSPPSLYRDARVDSIESIAMFYGPTDSIETTVLATKAHTTLEQWRVHQRDISKQEGLTLYDSTLTVNGQEAILWKAKQLFHEEKFDISILSVIGKEKVYTLITTCPRDQYPMYETAIRNSLLSFQLF